MDEIPNMALDSWVDNSFPGRHPMQCLAVAVFSCEFLYALHFTTILLEVISAFLSYYPHFFCLFVLGLQVIEQYKKQWRDIMWGAWGHSKTSQKELSQPEVEQKRPLNAWQAWPGIFSSSVQYTVQFKMTWKRLKKKKKRVRTFKGRHQL